MTATAEPTPPSRAINHMIAEWQLARRALADIDRAEHPDVTDKFGRTWTWWKGELYRHCGNAAPEDMISHFELPTQRALDNPNYSLCDICLDGRTRNVPDCKSEWNCDHAVHQAGTAPHHPHSE